MVVVALAGVGAGFVNAVAGGGTLISFPALTAVGLPVVSANVTSTVALSPGYLGGALAQRESVRRQRDRLKVLAPAGMLGGLAGGALLLLTGDELLERLVPFLILSASALLAGQERIRTSVERRRALRPDAARARPDHGISVGAIVAVFAASIYGGYFGAGLGIIFLAVLGALLPDDLRDVNALKQSMSFVVNLTAAAFFLFSGRVWWLAALVMAVGALAGGHLGGKLAVHLDPRVLRAVVVAIGVAVAIVYLVR
nr:sulfite exporter TauE/SafE family protein [Rhabdothermincola salaria]